MSGRGTIPIGDVRCSPVISSGAVRHPTVISSGAKRSREISPPYSSGIHHSRHTQRRVFLIGVSLKGWTRETGEKVTEESALAVNEISWACLSQIQGMSIVLNLGFAEHLEASALRSKNPDYEDNLLLATAQNAKVDYIITKDKGLLANDVVPAITPAEYVEMRG